jgi:hypothetical protein
MELRWIALPKLTAKLTATLRQPYPLYDYPNKLLRHTLGVACFIFLFLLVVRPFGTSASTLKFSYLTTCAIYGVVSGLSFLAVMASSSAFFSDYGKEERWTVASEMLLMVVLLTVIGSSNFLVRNMVSTRPDSFRLAYFLCDQAHAFIIGAFPIGFFIMLNFIYLYKTNSEKASLSSAFIHVDDAPASLPEVVAIASQSVYEAISVDVHAICFIRSNGNYIELYQQDGGSVKRQIIRNTLKDVESQLSGYPNIVRTHRSYLVNVEQVVSVNGNAQGYTLCLKSCADDIPVSRNNLKQFDAVIKGISL